MKKWIIFGILAAVALAAISFLLWPSASPFGGDNPDFVVTLSIADDTGQVLHRAEIGVSGEASVLDVTRHALQQAGIGCSVVGVGSTSYMQGIGELYEFDRGPTSGWVYTVDGVNASVSSGVHILTKDCVVEWVYTLEPIPIG